MRRHRAELVRYAEAIQAELLSEAKGERETVFSRQRSELTDALDRLVVVMRLRLATRFGEVARRDERPAIDDCVRELLMEQRRDGALCGGVLTSEYARFREDYLIELENSPEFLRAARTLRLASAHLRSWFALAFRDLIGISGVVTDIVTGRMAFPQGRDLAELLVEGTLLARGGGVAVAEMGTLLRSLAIRDVAEYGFGNWIIIGTRYRHIDGVRVAEGGN